MSSQTLRRWLLEVKWDQTEQKKVEREMSGWGKRPETTEPRTVQTANTVKYILFMNPKLETSKYCSSKNFLSDKLLRKNTWLSGASLAQWMVRQSQKKSCRSVEEQFAIGHGIGEGRS